MTSDNNWKLCKTLIVYIPIIAVTCFADKKHLHILLLPKSSHWLYGFASLALSVVHYSKRACVWVIYHLILIFTFTNIITGCTHSTVNYFLPFCVFLFPRHYFSMHTHAVLSVDLNLRDAMQKQRTECLLSIGELYPIYIQLCVSQYAWTGS